MSESRLRQYLPNNSSLVCSFFLNCILGVMVAALNLGGDTDRVCGILRPRPIGKSRFRIT